MGMQTQKFIFSELGASFFDSVIGSTSLSNAVASEEQRLMGATSGLRPLGIGRSEEAGFAVDLVDLQRFRS